jgi:hypothetical protein
VIVIGPPTPQDESKRQNYSAIAVSRSSGARRHFGRALRQRLYEAAEIEIRRVAWENRQEDLVFTDDEHEMVAAPRPQIPKPDGSGEKQNLPSSLINKIAVFVADGDKFGQLRIDLNNKLGPVAGRVSMTIVLEARMKELLAGLVSELAWLRDHDDNDNSRAAS